jgi:hypothetical protein
LAIADLIGTITSVNPSSTLTIQPAGTDEWIIHNFYTSSTIDLKVIGVATITVMPNLVESLSAYFFHASNTHYYQIVNKTGNTIQCGYDGIQSK